MVLIQRSPYCCAVIIYCHCVFYSTQSECEVKKWVTEMNRQFDEVDKFELLVE